MVVGGSSIAWVSMQGANLTQKIHRTEPFLDNYILSRQHPWVLVDYHQFDYDQPVHGRGRFMVMQGTERSVILIGFSLISYSTST
jgi:hypothetical protein